VNSPDQIFGQFPFLDGFRTGQFPWNMGGSSQPYYGALLYLIGKISQAKHWVEFGVDSGYTSYVLATGAQEAGGCYYGVEIDRAKAVRAHEELAARGWRHVILCGDSKSIPHFIWAPQVDVAFIDGEHSPEGILNDFRLIRPLLHQNSYVAVHDIYSLSVDGWLALLDQAEPPGYETLTFEASMGFGLMRPKSGLEEQNMRLLSSRIQPEIRNQVQPPTDSIEVFAT
jgi:hypothetical protein